MTDDLVQRLRDLRERFIFQGGSEFALSLADRIQAGESLARTVMLDQTSHDAILRSPGVQGLAQLGRNALDQIKQLTESRDAWERGFAERGRLIEQLERERDGLIDVRNEEIESLRPHIKDFGAHCGKSWDEAVIETIEELERERDELRRDSERLTKIFSAVEWYGHGYWLPDWFLGAVSTAHAPPTKEELCAAIDAMKG